jgi:site-specific DNA-methyltransferase (cytosine-N4-specific)
MYQEAVMVPMGDWRHSRLRNLSETDKRRDNSRVNSGFGKKIANWVGRSMAYPSNVLHLATECGNRNHSATFPAALPAWFIRLFTQPGDVILDPFIGSGTTAVASVELGRDYIGIELDPANVEIARTRLQAVETKQLSLSLREQKVEYRGEQKTRRTHPKEPRRFLSPPNQ